jgi:hypothetical protein
MNFKTEEKTGANYCLANAVVEHYLNSLLATNLTPAVVSLLAKAFLKYSVFLLTSFGSMPWLAS